MRDAFRKFFDEHMNVPHNGGSTRSKPAPRPAEDADRRIQIAACALLLELAYADDDFSEMERLHLQGVVRRHFDMDEATAKDLIAMAAETQAEAIDLFQFTSLIRENYDLGQKTLLAEIMWGLIMADGRISAREAYMLRKIANLLDLKPGYLSAARKLAEEDDD
ncbi:MAG: TerB family tellurite resistance protein [Gemmatimonadota bacterium]|jgi:uncharacterized tellurite resistance protein B-like protein